MRAILFYIVFHSYFKSILKSVNEIEDKQQKRSNVKEFNLVSAKKNFFIQPFLILGKSFLKYILRLKLDSKTIQNIKRHLT